MNLTATAESQDGPVDKTAEFLRLLSRHERSLLAFVLAMVPHWSDADDIMQEVHMRLWEQFDRYDSSKDFGAWARTIAYWQVRKWRTLSRRRPNSFGPEFIDLIAQHAETRIDGYDERIRVLQNCLQKLDPAKRQLIELYYAGKKTAQTLAAELDQSLHSVRHTLQRTRLVLAKCIQKSLAQRDRS
jgi:RNA polymerase sigma-70 factor (ECF subfamily)